MSKYKQSGQGMTEYIIVVALIAIAAIGVFASFGDTVKNQGAALSKELAGDDGSNSNEMAGTRAAKGELRAKNNSTLKGFANN
jgi:Flp pilus assembly pilin Flp